MEPVRFGPDPNAVHPNPLVPSVCYIKNVITRPNILVGDYTYYDDPETDALPCWNRDWEPAGEVVRLLVVPAWENQGMGRRLLADAMERLAGMGCRSCRILVGRENHRALRSYAKLGFGRTGRARLYDTDFDCFEQELF